MISNSTSNSSIFNPNKTNEIAVNPFTSSIGISLALLSGLLFSISSIVVKKLSTARKVHFSTVNLFASYVGLPICLLIVVSISVIDKDPRDLTRVNEADFIWECGYVLVSAISGVTSNIFYIISLKFEEATKILMYRTIQLLLAFLFQYFFLDIVSNMLSIIGAVCVTAGILVIVSYNVLEKREQERQVNEADENIGDRCIERDSPYKSVNKGCVRNVLLYKF